MKKYATIIWDFNGTIIDDVNASLGAVNDMLTKRSQPTIDLAKYRSAVDTPIWRFYETVFEDGTITPQEAVMEFDSGYEKHLQKNPLMEGIVEVLEHFKMLGVRQIIVSASHVDKVKARLSNLDIIDYFDAVLGRSDYMAEGKTYLAQAYFAENNLSAEQTVVVGDCVNDYDVAVSLGCDCILNTKGHQSRLEFEGIDAQIIDTLPELKNLITT